MPAEQPEYDLRLMPFTRQLFKYIREVRPGSEFAIMYALCARISSAIIGGRAVMFVAPMGEGKGDVMKVTRGLIPQQLVPLYTNVLSDTKIKRWLKKYHLEGRNIECSIEDMSHSADDYHKFVKTFFTISGLVTDKAVAEIDKDLDRNDPRSRNKNSQEARVKSFSVIACTTNYLDVRMEDFDAYNSMWRDRITRYYIMFSKEARELRRVKYTDSPERGKKAPTDKVRDKIKAMLPKFEIPDRPFDIYNKYGDLDYKIFPEFRERLYGHQHTDDRASDYFSGDLTAFALLNGRNFISETDIAFYNLYSVNMVLSSATSICQRLAQTTLKYGGDIRTISKKLWLPVSEIKNGIDSHDQLKGFGNNPVYLEDTPRGQRVMLRPELLHKIEMQEKFIADCIDYEGD